MSNPNNVNADVAFVAAMVEINRIIACANTTTKQDPEPEAVPA